jgi:hypothetical protein
MLGFRFNRFFVFCLSHKSLKSSWIKTTSDKILTIVKDYKNPEGALCIVFKNDTDLNGWMMRASGDASPPIPPAPYSPSPIGEGDRG